MFQQPRRAKKLYFDVIPRAVDDYLAALAAYPGQAPAEQLANPVWHIHAGTPPAADLPISFALLLNLAGAAHADSKAQLWSYIEKYAPGTRPQEHPLLDRLAGYALAYYADFVAPTKRFRAPTDQERAALAELAAALPGLPDDAEAIQNEVYEVGKRAGFANLRDWFKACYEVLLGQAQGPRMGSFIALYGRTETVALIEKALAGDLAARANAEAPA